MLWNIKDHRSNNSCNEVDAVFEPSCHDNSIDGASKAEEDESWCIDSLYNTTIKDAINKAEKEWTTPVTIYLYDAGTKPIG